MACTPPGDSGAGWDQVCRACSRCWYSETRQALACGLGSPSTRSHRSARLNSQRRWLAASSRLPTGSSSCCSWCWRVTISLSSRASWSSVQICRCTVGSAPVQSKLARVWTRAGGALGVLSIGGFGGTGAAHAVNRTAAISATGRSIVPAMVMSFPAAVSVDEDGSAVDDIFLGSLVGRWWEGPGATHRPLRGRIQQLVATPVDLVTEYPTVGVHSDLIRDVALALEIVGIALVTRRLFVYRPFRPLQLGGDPVLDRVGIGRGDRPAAYRCRVRRRGGRGGGPLLIGAKAMHGRAGR